MGCPCSRSDRFAITSHRSRNLVKPISSSASRVSLLLCGQCRLVAGTIGLATHHNRPDDPCCLVCHRDGCKPHGLSRQQIGQRWIDRLVAIFGTDDFFGEGCLAGQVQRISTVTTMMDSVIARIEKAAIIRVIHYEPAFAEMFIAHLLARTIRVEADLVDQLFNSSEKRLARMLLLLANFGKESKPEPIIAKISQETLAEMIGTTRSRVSFFMNKFRELGFIDYNGSGVEIHSSLLNAVLHDQPQIKS